MTDRSNDELVTCPRCRGRGSNTIHVLSHCTYGSHSGSRVQMCPLCTGKGKITAEARARLDAGRAMAEDRKARLMSLRDEAKRLGITPKELNDREWGRGSLER